MSQLPRELSPLELLEQRSRRLALKLNDDPSKSLPSQNQSKPSLKNVEEKNEEKQDDPSGQPGAITGAHRTNSTNSLASLGSILGSFRLSTFSIMDPDSDAASIRSSRDSVYEGQERNNQGTFQNQSRTAHYSLPFERPVSHHRSDSSSTIKPVRSPQPSNSQTFNFNDSDSLPTPPPSSRDRYSGISSSSPRSPTDQRRLPSFSKPVTNSGQQHSSGVTSSISPQHTGGVTSSHGPRPSISSSHSYGVTSSITPAASPGLPMSDAAKHQSIRLVDHYVNDNSPPEMPALNRSASATLPTPHYMKPVNRSLSHEETFTPAHLRSASNSSNFSKSTSDSKKHSHEDDSFEVLRLKGLNNALTLEEQVSLGIIYHENGNLRESSYHWQCAAAKGDPTGMLLYGLALRHGWGIRQNPEEAFKCLRKAIGPTVDNNSLEDLLKNNVSQDLQDKLMRDASEASSDKGKGRVKKAQIALALYELGMCYLNSWGVYKDEDMALRCFELAGSMGDVDALCEAASLWMKNGPKGRKKNLQRAAKLYRTAGEKGASMVSNSWIYKDKYMDDDEGKKKKKK